MPLIAHNTCRIAEPRMMNHDVQGHDCLLSAACRRATARAARSVRATLGRGRMPASHAHIPEVTGKWRRSATPCGTSAPKPVSSRVSWPNKPTGVKARSATPEPNSFMPDEGTVERLDRAFNADGQLMNAYASTKTPTPGLVHSGRDPLVFSDHIRKIRRTDVGRDTIDQLSVITEQLCCEYGSRPAAELRVDAHHQLEYVQQLFEGPTRLAEHRELLVIAGWLALLIGCLNYDLGLARHAETARTAAFQLGREAAHGEIVA
jgi:hypothetical protein